MPKQRFILEGKCDRSLYVLDPAPAYPVLRVAYRDPSIPVHPNGHTAEELLFEAPTTRSYLRVAKTDSPPETIKEAFWFVRALYEHLRRPVWFMYQDNALIVWPPPLNDGDWIIVELDLPPETSA